MFSAYPAVAAVKKGRKPGIATKTHPGPSKYKSLLLFPFYPVYSLLKTKTETRTIHQNGIIDVYVLGLKFSLSKIN